MPDEAQPGRAHPLVLWLARFGVLLAALWGFAEATLFFVVPDVAVGMVGLFRPRKAVTAGLAAVAGACVGGAALFLLGGSLGGDLRALMDAVPAITPEMLEQARSELAEDGAGALMGGPGQGIPYKLYVAEWSLQGGALLPLVLWTIPARAIRIVGFGLLMAAGGWLFRNRVAKRPVAWATVYVAAWTAFYAVYWFVVVPMRFG